MASSSNTNFLSGYKTYIVAFVSVVTAFSAYLDGKESFSTALTSTPGLLLFLGSGLAAVRSAIARIESKLPANVQAVVDPAVSAVEADVSKKV
jgi:hypothetical protein